MEYWHRGLNDNKYHTGDPMICKLCGFPKVYNDEAHITEKERAELMAGRN